MLGPPGAGKGTQATRLAADLQVPQISTGDLFRNNIAAGTKLGLEAKQYLDAGDLVPAGLTNALVDDRLNEADVAGGVILDGFPRSVEQAEALQQAWQPLPTTAAPLPPAPPLDPAQWHWHSDPAAFAAGVEQIRRWIAAGDLFQANLTACCEQPWPPNAGNGSEVGDPLALVALYLKLRQHCPAPFGALAIGSGSAAGEALLSASPERFLQVDGAGLVETRPIKGTRPRHSNPERDADAAAELVSSPKDRAENVMIVDLLRHDLGRVCELGSITVPQLVGLESYRQVHHLTSVVQGQRRNDVGLAELLRACWPGGSISGAPKIRACQRLSQLEPLPRGAYCGSLFWLGADGRFDSSILIRTLLLANGVLRAHAGGGIVADSDPAAEAEEMGWKIQPLLEALA